MIICSWNINSVRIRIEHLVNLISTLNPDIIFLQEIKCLKEEFPDFYKKYDYNLVINGQKGRHGVAILIKKDIDFKEINFQQNLLSKEARICGVSIEKKKKINLINIYTPNGNPINDYEKYNFKINWLKELYHLLRNKIDNYENIIIAGDFNVLENEYDVKNFSEWKNDALGSLQVRKLFRKILFLGFTNLIRIFYKPGEKFSFWDYQKASWERNYGLLIDHFLVSPKIVSHVKKLRFESEYRAKPKPSDHIPLWIKLNV